LRVASPARIASVRSARGSVVPRKYRIANSTISRCASGFSRPDVEKSRNVFVRQKIVRTRMA
jgi:hypothetical protein